MNRLLAFSSLATVMVLLGCGHSRPKSDDASDSSKSSPEVAGPPEPYGPQPAPAAPVYGPEPIQLRPVVLVLGPGLARGYAYVGVLKALADQKIPIGAIVGTEMGALIGALYANTDTVNRFEWALLRFKDEVFEERGAISSLLGTRGKKLEDALSQTLGGRDLKSGKFPLLVAVESKSGRLMIVENGPAAAAIRAALSDPGLMDPSEVPGVEEKAGSAAVDLPFAISEAKKLGIGPVIAVSVLEGTATSKDSDEASIAGLMVKARKNSDAELKEAELVLRPDMKGIGFLDFKKRNEASFRGKKAALTEIKTIRHLVGMPETEASIEP